MKHILSFTLVCVLLLSLSVSARRYMDDRVVTWHFGSIIHPANKSIKFDLEFFTPTQPGTYPVIVFLSGLDGSAPGFLYSDFLTKLTIASDSILIVFDGIKLTVPMPDKEENLFEMTLNWTLANIDGLIQVNTHKHSK